jgi:hypothetical protein
MNSSILDRLLLVAKRNRLPHALLFAGNSLPTLGSTAQELASHLLSDLSRVRERIHPDFFWLETDKQEISIDLIRELQIWIAKGPYETDLKVAVMKEAEKMNLASQNAILKTLEEPPPHGKLILLCKATDRLLPTILSRVQKIQFPDETTSKEEEPKWVEELRILLKEPTPSFETIFSFTEQVSKERGELKFFFREFEKHLRDQLTRKELLETNMDKISRTFEETLKAESDLLRRYGNVSLTLDSLLTHWFQR